MSMSMTRVIVMMACGLGLASCTSWMPSFDMFAPKPTSAMLSIESDPPGAEARTSLGNVCRTPCTQQVPLSGDITINYALNGYVPMTMTVRTTGADSGAQLDPNPVFAEMKPVGPPPKPPPPKRRPRPPQPPPPAAAAPQPQMQGGFGPPPSTSTFSPPR